MNRERRDERDAASVVERLLGVVLIHADTNGGVDYRSPDRRDAVEVTRLTDGRKRAGRDALAVSRKVGTLEPPLQTCWVVHVPETQWGLKAFLQTVHPALVELERAGESFFEQHVAAVHVLEGGRLAALYRPLLGSGVERAEAMPHHGHRERAHHVIPALLSGGSSSGSDAAVNLLTDELLRRTDNLTKLRASGAVFRHLFVWLDDDTRFDIARPLSRAAPPWSDQEFGLPSAPPTLDPAITHLWVMHEGSRLGWLWDGATWSELRDL